MKGRLKGRTASFDDYERFFDAEQIHKFSGSEVGFQDPSSVSEKCHGCIHWFLNQVSGWTACEIMSLKKQPVPSSGVCRFWSKDGRKYPLLDVL